MCEETAPLNDVSRSQRHQDSQVASTDSTDDCLVLHVDAVGQGQSHKGDGLEFEQGEVLGVLEGTVGEHGRRCTHATCLHLLVI